ncbi:MAG: hypothetical protein A2W17_02945 [Planctomycetes bacterium RBG_16_41_13]|nr:MAG: hypothetical protein A2W17_02945 [Planctomycetes bacterium RBG_16_41_13]
MPDNDTNYEWTKKGGTLSDKNAFKEFGLTQNDIMKAINEGKLQFREGSIYGNPYFRLLRSEVEKLAEERFGKDLFNKKKAKVELKKINKELVELKSKIAILEMRKDELTQIIN